MRTDAERLEWVAAHVGLFAFHADSAFVMIPPLLLRIERNDEDDWRRVIDRILDDRALRFRAVEIMEAAA